MSETLQVQHATVFDDATRHVARIYAEALLNAAEKSSQAAALLEDLEAVVTEVLPRDPAFELFLGSPAVARERRAEILRTTFEGKADELFVNFLLVLNMHDRLGLFRAIALAYRTLYDRRAGRVPVEVEAAVSLTDEQQERLRVQLRASLKREPIFNIRVNPDLLGGLVVRVGDWVYDASVRARLELIKNQLITRSSYEIQSRRDHFRTGA
jgi:F-type H+-transporting ATPase subunit delta